MIGGSHSLESCRSLGFLPIRCNGNRDIQDRFRHCEWLLADRRMLLRQMYQVTLRLEKDHVRQGVLHV
jgi:hypothetical protein